MKELQWGETPWDGMPKDELLREVQRMFSALERAHSVLSTMKVINQDDNPFWGQRGSGGKALGRVSQVIDSVYEEYSSESVYKSFFRYAASLLFDVPDEEKWIICPECGDMWTDAINRVGTACSELKLGADPGCRGVFRLLEWQDLAKEKAS